MSAEDREIKKLKANNAGSVIASAGYADTLMEELSVAGLSLIDTEDEDLVQALVDSLRDLWYPEGWKEYPSFSRRHAVKIILRTIKARQIRHKKIGKVPGKKPKKK